MGPGSGSRIRPVAVALLGLGSLALASAVPLRAGQVVLQNDNVVNFGNAIVLTGFVAGEEGAAWLTSICDGEITALRILWLSGSGGQPPVLGEALRVYDGGAFPAPGSLLLELLGPQMIDGGFNEFVLFQTVPVTSGQTVVVSFRFLSAPPVPNGPSLVTDDDGCQAGRNAVFAIPGGWSNLCSFGASGDFAIRAVVDCTGPIVLFADGFESGDTSAWSSTVP